MFILTEMGTIYKGCEYGGIFQNLDCGPQTGPWTG